MSQVLILSHRDIASRLLDIESGLRALVRLGETCDTPEEEIGVQMAARRRPMVEQLAQIRESLRSYWLCVNVTEEKTPCPPPVCS